MKSHQKHDSQSFTRNGVSIIRGGSEYFKLVVELIDSATHTIQLLTYIFEADETGQKVSDALIRAARRNVKVFVVVDGYASQHLPGYFRDNLKEAGINFRFFDPLLKTNHFYFGRRLHSKVLVVDSRFSLLGGINITNRYNDMPGQPAWLDFAVLAEGPVAIELCQVCWRIWKGFQITYINDPCRGELLTGKLHQEFSALVRLRRNDWTGKKLEITNSYLKMFRTAKSHITLLSSYALPGSIFRKNLVRAVKRGVKIRMIISGQSDVMLVKQAERYWYKWLLRHNIEIYEYTKNVLHGKLAICDNEWLTIGSYNVNDLSAYASIEVNLDIADVAFAVSVETEMQKIINNDCVRVSNGSLIYSNSIFSKLGYWFSYNILRVTFNLFTFYYRQKNNQHIK